MANGSYRAEVAVAFEVLAEGLAPFIDGRMTAAFPGDDWILMAAAKLGKRRDVLVSAFDPHFQLEVMNRWWGPAFARHLPESARDTITDLRTARNHWAHPDEDHPFDLEYAMKVHQDAEEILTAIDSPVASRMADLLYGLRWDSVKQVAREKGMTEAEAAIQQLVGLQAEYERIQAQLDSAKQVARSATGRTRAVSRQLAELQSQYAAVSSLADEYEALQRQLLERHGHQEEAAEDTSAVRDQLAAAEIAVVNLQRESSLLRDQLAETRKSISLIDPVETEIGRRWIWLVTVLILLLGVLVVVAYYVPK